MRTFTALSCNDAFAQVSRALLHDVEFVVSPRGLRTWEITNAVITITNPYDRLVRHPVRNLSLRYLAGEFLWYERGSDRLAEILHYSGFWARCSDDGASVRSAYGARLYGKLVDQWSTVRRELARDPDTRRAVLVIVTPLDIRDGVRDVPCTVALQFLIRGGHLHLTTWMRSNDLFLGFCYDAAVFTLWQEKMLTELREFLPDLMMGTYTHIGTSLHVYETHFKKLEDVARSPDAVIDDDKFEMPRIANTAVIQDVQQFESALRIKGRENVALVCFNDPFADWLGRCLYEG